MIGLWMMVAMIAGIFIGFPISFTLIFLGLIFGYWGSASWFSISSRCSSTRR